MDAGLGAEGAALHERAFAISDCVLHQDGVGQIPMNAGEILETELIGAIGAVPHTRFHHLKPPLWPLGAATSRLLVCRLDRRFFWRFLARQGAAPSGRPLCVPTQLADRRFDPISSLSASAKLRVPKA